MSCNKNLARLKTKTFCNMVYVQRVLELRKKIKLKLFFFHCISRQRNIELSSSLNISFFM